MGVGGRRAAGVGLCVCGCVRCGFGVSVLVWVLVWVGVDVGARVDVCNGGWKEAAGN